MPDTELTPQPVPAAEAPATAKPGNLRFYMACGVILALSIAIYGIFGKYKLTKTTLDVTTKTLTETSSKLEQQTNLFSQYKKNVETSTVITKTPVLYQGKVVGYVTSYTKNTASSSTGSNSASSTLTASGASTVASNSVSHATSLVQEGQATTGLAYVVLPLDIVTGKLSSFGLGLDHHFFLGTEVGLEFGTSDVTKMFDSLYGKMHLGVQTSF